MGNRIRIAVASLAVVGATGVTGVADDVARFGDDLVRIVLRLPDPPRSAPKVPIPHPVPVPDEAMSAAKRWTDHLSLENAKKVTEDACKLKDLSGLIVTDAEIEQWALQRGYYSYGDDRLPALVGLAKEVRGNKNVEAICNAVG